MAFCSKLARLIPASERVSAQTENVRSIANRQVIAQFGHDAFFQIKRLGSIMRYWPSIVQPDEAVT